MSGTANGNGARRALADGGGAAGRRLRSWKEIAAYFGTDERTVKRWEARGMPVQRVPGGERTPVYAEVGELERWLKSRNEEPEAPTPASAAAAAPRRRLIAIAAALLLALAGVATFVLLRGENSQPAAAKHEPPQKAVDLYTAAVYQSDRATPDSMRRAIALYGQAIAEDPAYAEAYAGLASAYIRLRAFAAVTEAEAYPRAKAAAERAIDLDPNLAQAHAAIGFVSFYSDWDFARGLRHFSEAARLDPRSAAGRYEYGIALLHSGDFAGALRELDAAQRIDPRRRGILANRGFALYLLGRRDEGIALIRQVAADDPDFMPPHHFLSLIHFGEGDWQAGLDQGEIVARLRQDTGRLALVAAGRRALAQGGGEAMLRVGLAGQLRRHAAGQEPAYVVAEFYALLGERAQALRYLRQSVAAREPLALTMRLDPLLRNLRGDPEFERLAAQAFQPS